MAQRWNMDPVTSLMSAEARRYISHVTRRAPSWDDVSQKNRRQQWRKQLARAASTHACSGKITSSVNASVRTSERCTVELVVLCVFLSARTKNIAYRPPAACFFSLLLLCSSLFLFIIYAEEVILSSLCVYLSAGKLKTSLATDFNELPGGVE